MALFADFVLETANSPGTGTFNLAGTSTGRRTWIGAFASGTQVFYTAHDGSSWETGVGTVTSGSPNTLSRDTVLQNSLGTTAKINFTSSVNVYCEPPALRHIWASADNSAVLMGSRKVSGVVAGVAADDAPRLDQVGAPRSQIFTASGSFTVPAGVYRIRVTVIGGGGPGGFSTNWASGGGGSGGRAVETLTVTPGQVVSVTVGAGGVVTTTSGTAGTPGGTSSFGSYLSATGGSAGGGGAGPNAGGSPGVGTGGDINDYGSYGGDSIPLGQRGGDGGGPGNGRGTTGYTSGLAAQGYGGGGGGGGSSNTSGSGSGASGGTGMSGVVIVEY